MTTLLDKTKRAAVSDELAALLVKDVQKKFPEWSDGFGRRGVDQMVGFLAACAVTPEPLGPSMIVDEFWHAFIVRTVDYAEFCDRIAGRFIHHIPEDEREHDPRLPGKDAAMRVRTLTAITGGWLRRRPRVLARAGRGRLHAVPRGLSRQPQVADERLGSWKRDAGTGTHRTARRDGVERCRGGHLVQLDPVPGPWPRPRSARNAARRACARPGVRQGRQPRPCRASGHDGVGVDIAPLQIAHARAEWPGLDVVCGDALAYLEEGDEPFDAVYSVFGALWFVDPDAMLPAIHRRLRGTLAFSCPRMNAVAALPRWDFEPDEWGDRLEKYGFVDIESQVIERPESAVRAADVPRAGCGRLTPRPGLPETSRADSGRIRG